MAGCLVYFLWDDGFPGNLGLGILVLPFPTRTGTTSLRTSSHPSRAGSHLGEETGYVVAM
jgi:hypothetical protein